MSRASSKKAATKTQDAGFHSVGFTISSVGFAVSRRFKDTLAPLDLEPREFALLRGVAADEGVSQQGIADREQIPASRVVALVDALERRGLVERRPDARDRRTRALYLTRNGRGLLNQALALVSDLEHDFSKELTLMEREQLIDLLQRVGVSLGLAPEAHSLRSEEPAEEGPASIPQRRARR